MKKQILKQESYIKDNSVHQAILDVCYTKWQDNREWYYHDMIIWVQQTYGDVATFVVLIGKYNEQVTNGGHVQYYDNRYCGTKEFNFDTHILMLDLFKNTDLMYNEIGEKVFKNARAFLDDADFDMDKEDIDWFTCEECGGGGSVYENEEDENNDNEKECSECDGEGEWEEEVDNENYGCFTNDLDRYDSKYYMIYEEWMDILEVYFKTEFLLT